MDHFDVDSYVREKANQRRLERRREKFTFWKTAPGDLFIKAVTRAAARPEKLALFFDQFLTPRERRELTRLSKRLRHKTAGIYEILADIRAKERADYERAEEDRVRENEAFGGPA